MKYKIKKEKHYAEFTLDRLLPFTTLSQQGTFSLSKECWHTRESIEYTGNNKLTGVAQIFGVHQNSGRLVWQPDFKEQGTIIISGYVYSGGGKWTAKEITRIKVEKDYTYSIRWVKGYWLFTVNEKEVMIAGDKPKCPVKTYFYFGGKSTAPQTMTMKIQRL